MPFNPGQKAEWYKFFADVYGFPAESLKHVFEDELDCANGPDSPLEVPDKISVSYKYSYGGQSRFFRELRENKKIYAAKCAKCGKVFFPPRADCNVCYEPTEWVELTGKGTIVACVPQYVTAAKFIKQIPFVCAYVKLDGTESLLMANIETPDAEKCLPGVRVKAEFRKRRHGRITDFYFKLKDSHGHDGHHPR